MKSLALSKLDFSSRLNYREELKLYGGQVLGLKILEEMIAVQDCSFTIPPYTTLPLNDVQAIIEAGRISAVADFANKIICRWSGIREAFSSESCRGANSSLGNPLLSVDHLMLEQIRRWVSLSRNETHRAVILQSWVNRPSAMGFHCHTRSDRVFIELTRAQEKYLSYHLLDNGREFSSSILPAEIDEAIKKIRIISRKIFNSIDFDLDIEGVISGSDATILQLRPIPKDFIFSRALSDEIIMRLDKGDFQSRGWPQNSYRVTADVGNRPIYLGESDKGFPSPASIRDEVDSLCSLIQLGLVPEDRGHRLIAALSSMQCWHTPEYVAASSRNHVMLHISPRIASVLEHDPTRLPPAGGLRKAYNCFYSSEISDKDAYRYSFISDGYIAIAA